MTNSIWNVTNAKTIFAQLTKIANDQLDAVGAPDESESAGPQEVVDALEVIVQQLEEVSAAIPAESSMQEEEQIPQEVEAPMQVPEEPELTQSDNSKQKQEYHLTNQLKLQILGYNQGQE